MLLPIDLFRSSVFWIVETVVSATIEGTLGEGLMEEFVVDDMTGFSLNECIGWEANGEALLTVVSAPVANSVWLSIVNRSAPVTDPICKWL